jgi:hypothetical protein
MRTSRDSNRTRQHVRTPADVRQVLATEIERLVANPDLDPMQRARILVPLARAALRAMEVETLEARLEALESALKMRPNPQPKEDTP